MRAAFLIVTMAVGGCAACRPAGPAAAAAPNGVARYSIQVDRQAAADAGVSQTDIATAVAKATGRSAGPATTAGIDDVRAIVVATVDGRRVRLGDIAAVSVETGPAPSGR